MATALVTGIQGQDGGYLAEALAADGWVVHGFTRTPGDVPAHLRALADRVVLHRTPLGDGAQLTALVRRIQPDQVYNLAGVSSVALSWEQPALTAEVNGVFVARLLQAVLDQQERSGRAVAFVQASSAELYAGATSAPQDEATPMSPVTPYGASKAFAHHLVHVFRSRGLHASNAVLYNHESPRRPRSFVTRKITSEVAAIANGSHAPLKLGNLHARRDWGWAPEYVDGMRRIAAHETADDFVLATGVSHTVADFVAAAFAHADISDWQPWVEVEATLTRPSDAVDLVGRPVRARERLAWVPKVGFTELVGRMVDADLDAHERANAHRSG